MTQETTRPITRIWDAAEHLQSDEDMAAYLEAALEENDASLFAAALGDIARAKGMAQLARETGLARFQLLFLQTCLGCRQAGAAQTCLVRVLVAPHHR